MDFSKLLGLSSDNDMQNLQKLLPLMTPIVSPWLTLGTGALLGLYGQHEAIKDREREIALNAAIARGSPWTGMTPQTSFQKPSAVGHLVGGIGAAQGTAKSINELSVPYNMKKKIDEDNAALQEKYAKRTAELLNRGRGPITEEYDATLRSQAAQPQPSYWYGGPEYPFKQQWEGDPGYLAIPHRLTSPYPEAPLPPPPMAISLP